MAGYDGELHVDEEFKLLLAQLKHHVKFLLPDDQRLRMTVWLKKLLEASQRNERNAYASLLLRMLRNGKIDAPFSSDPPKGPLPNLQKSSRDAHQLHSDTSPLSSHCSTITSTTSPPFSSGVASNPNDQLPKVLSESSISNSGPSSVNTVLAPISRTSSELSWVTKANSDNEHYSHHVLIDRNAGILHEGFIGPKFGTQLAVSAAPAGNTDHSNRASPHTSQPHPSVCLSPHTSQPHPSVCLSPRASHPHPSVYTNVAPSMAIPSPLTTVSDLSSNESTDVAVTMANTVGHGLVSPNSEDSEASDVTVLLQPRQRPCSRSRPQRHAHRTGAPTVPSPVSLRPPSPGLLDDHRPVSALGKRLTGRRQPKKKQMMEVVPSFSEDTAMLLDQKCDQIDTKAELQSKAHKFETKCRQLEQRVAQLERDCMTLRNDRDMQVSQLKCKSQQQWQSLQADMDKKLHTLFTNFEREKLELEQKHSKELQATMERCSVQMKRMENEHNALIKTNSELLSELEARVQELTTENELQLQAQSRLTQEKAEFERKCVVLRNDVERKTESLSAIERDCVHLRQDRDALTKQFQLQLDQKVQSLGYEHSIEKAKLAEEVTELQHRLQEAKKQQETLSEIEVCCQCRLEEKEAQCREREDVLQQELTQTRERIMHLEMLLKDCREQVADANITSDARSQHAETVIEEVKVQMGNQAERLRREISHLETSLSESEASRERERGEHRKQMQMERERVGKEIVQLKLEHEKIIGQLKKNHEQEMTSCGRDARAAASEELKVSLADAECRAHTKAMQDAKTIASLEKQLAEVKGQLQGAQFGNMSEMNDLRRKFAEEKQALVKSHETSITKLKVQLEFQRTSIMERQKVEMDGMIEKYNRRIHQLENDFAFKTRQTSETINALQAQIKGLQDDNEREKQLHHKQTGEWSKRREEEMSSIKGHYEAMTQSLREECDAAHRTVSELEEKASRAQLDFSSKLSTMKMHYESRLKGMLPVSVTQEYESSIYALKTQVSILHQKAEVLQKEVDRKQASRTHMTPTVTKVQSS